MPALSDAQPPLPLEPDPAPSTAAVHWQQLDTTAHFPYPLSYYIRRTLWNMLRGPMFHLSFPRAFRWRRFLLRRFGAKLTNTTLIYNSVRIFHPWLLEIGNTARWRGRWRSTTWEKSRSRRTRC